MLTCASCGTQSPETFRFCPACAAPLAPAGPTEREERKVVTVLFADLVGFTGRSERLDPEDVRAVLEPFHAHLRSELERYGGTVEKYIGDAVMAVFGAPTAHEDDPERALRAALAIRDWAQAQDGVEVRIGINTGETIVDVGARPERGQSMVAGDIVNTAARLQDAAPVNGVMVGEQTYRATRDAIDYGERTELRLKGKAEVVAAWTAREARSRLGTDVAVREPTELVGRESDVRLLVESLARVRRERSAQLVTLVGVPGIGKSRLVHELFRAVEQDPDLITWRQGRCLPYGDGLSYWALGEIVKAESGILETDDDAQVQARLEAAVSDVVDDHAEWVVGHLGPLVGLVPESKLTGDRRSEAFAAWRGFIDGVAARHPLVLVFEDIQWADDGLLDFIDHLIDWVTDVPLLVVATTRPELLHQRPGWGGGKANAVTISLSTLTTEETARIVDSVLARVDASTEVRAAALAKAEGNPLYAEEFARLLGESGTVDEAAIPAGVQGIIAARIDLLSADAKRVLQAASVLGKVFWAGAVAEMAERDLWQVEAELHDLERRELVRRDRRSSVAGETELSFRHLLVRDVVYGQIPRAARGDLHVAAARWIDSLGRGDDHAEMLAHHYVQAFELTLATGREDGELAASARQALRVAAERARALNAFAAAADLYERALALWPDDAPERARLLLGYGSALHHSGSDQAFDVLEAASGRLLAEGDVDGAAHATAELATQWWLSGQRDRADALGRRAYELIADQPASPEKAWVLAQRAAMDMLSADFTHAVELADEAGALAERFELEDLRIQILATVGTGRARQDAPAGTRALEQALELALQQNSPEAARIHANLGYTYLTIGDIRRDVEQRDLALGVATRFGVAPMVRFIRGVKVGTSLLQGAWDDAAERANAFIAECEAGSPHYLEPEVRQWRATIRFARGDTDGARSDLDRALVTGRQAKDPQIIQHVLSTAARLMFELGELKEARSSAHELLASLGAGARLDGLITLAWVASALDVATELKAQLTELRPSDSLWLQACREVLEEDFVAAASTLERIGSVPDEARAHLEAARRFAAVGQREEAARHRQLADDFHRSVGAVRYLEGASTDG